MTKTQGENNNRGEIIVRSHNNGLWDKLRDGLTSLVEISLCDVHKSTAIVKVQITPDGYKYDLDYGNPGISVGDMTQLQELARQGLDSYIHNDPGRRAAKVESTFYHRTFDPLGLRIRLWRYLSR